MRSFRTAFSTEFDNAEVIEKIRDNLRGLDTRLLEEFKFLSLRDIAGFYGVCDLPVGRPQGTDWVSGYRVRCGISTEIVFPLETVIDVARDRARETGQGRTIEHDFSVDFSDLDELSLWLAARTLFHFVSAVTGVVVEPEECHANAFGLDWLRDWRASRALGSGPR